MLAQTCKDFEIIIVDDGSTDDTQAVLGQLAQTFGIICLHQKNAGPAQAKSFVPFECKRVILKTRQAG